MKLLGDLFQVKSIEVVGKGEIRSCVMPNGDHAIYKSHFPQNPTTPGVCLIQLIVELLQENFRVDLQLKELYNIKYLAILVPNEGCEVVCDIQYNDEEKRVKATIYDSQKVYAKMLFGIGQVSLDSNRMEQVI